MCERWIITGILAVALAACGGTSGSRSSRKDAETTGGATGFTPVDGTDASDGGGDGTDGGEGSDGTSGGEGTDGLADVIDSPDSPDTTGGTGEDATTGADVPDFNDCQSDADCPAEAPTCAPQGVCIFCYPGTFTCDGNTSMRCKQFGDGYELAEDCGAVGATCNAQVGKCESGCGGGIGKTNAGCDFYAVDLRNAYVNDGINGVLDAQNAQFAVIVSNTSKSNSALVSVTRPDGTKTEQTVGPDSLQKFTLPATFGLKGSGQTQSAFRVQSSQPVTVYQFNPLSNSGVFSNDASVLLPVSGVGTEYYVITLPHGGADFASYFTVVGVDPGGTQVTYKVTGSTAAGGGLPALSSGQTHTVTLGPGEVISVESASIGVDLTGSHITADKPVVAFAGHVAAATGTECCADHLEQQLTPVSSWGKEFVIARSMERGSEKDYFRVIAAKNNTQVTVSPAVVSPPTKTLQAGEVWKFTSNAHIKLVANQPIMAMQFLASSQEAGGSGAACSTNANCPMGSVCESDPVFGGGTCVTAGDPAMILAVPTEQWQTDYVFLAPDSYFYDFVNIVAPPGANVQLDGVAVTQWDTIGGASYVTHRRQISDGEHRVTSDKPVSIVVYGYDDDVSYGYPGGLGLSKIQ